MPPHLPDKPLRSHALAGPNSDDQVSNGDSHSYREETGTEAVVELVNSQSNGMGTGMDTGMNGVREFKVIPHANSFRSHTDEKNLPVPPDVYEDFSFERLASLLDEHLAKRNQELLDRIESIVRSSSPTSKRASTRFADTFMENMEANMDQDTGDNADADNDKAKANGDGSAEQTLILSQFSRLDQKNQDRWDIQQIRSFLHDFDGMEMEDLKGLIIHLHSLVPDSIGSASPQRPSTAEVAGRPTMKNMDKHVWITQAMMFLLRLDEGLLQDPTPHSVQRDALKLREALQQESDKALYADDGHLRLQTKGPTGRMQTWFEVVPNLVIVTNCLCIGLSSDIYAGHVAWQILELLFLLAYSVEAFLKIRLYGCRWYFTGVDKHWNIFDFFCLVLSIVDQGIFLALNVLAGSGGAVEVPFVQLLKVLRLLRLGRLVRSLNLEIFAELKSMVVGFVSGLRALLWAQILLLVMLYAFGIALRQSVGDNEPEFSTVPNAMFTLFRCFTEGCAAYDGTPLPERLRARYKFPFTVVYTAMFFCVAIGMCNMILAVFIDTVLASQLRRKLHSISETSSKVETDIKEGLIRLVLQSKANGVSSEVEEEILSLDQSFDSRGALVRAQFEVLDHGDCMISRSAFMAFLDDREFVWTLYEADIETANSSSIFDVLDADLSGFLTVNEVYSGLQRLRGPICKSEIVGIRLKVRHVSSLLTNLHKHMDIALD